MYSNTLFPTELAGTLTDLRAGHRLSNAEFNIFRQRLLSNDAKEVNTALYRKELISSRQFNANERAIERDRRLEAAANKEKPAAKSYSKKVAVRHLGRKAA